MHIPAIDHDHVPNPDPDHDSARNCDPDSVSDSDSVSAPGSAPAPDFVPAPHFVPTLEPVPSGEEQHGADCPVGGGHLTVNMDIVPNTGTAQGEILQRQYSKVQCSVV